MLSGIILYQPTSADTVWYQSVTSRCCPVTAQPDGVEGNEKASEGSGRNQTTVGMRGR